MYHSPTNKLQTPQVHKRAGRQGLDWEHHNFEMTPLGGDNSMEKAIVFAQPFSPLFMLKGRRQERWEREAERWSAVITQIKNDDKYGSGKQALQARQLQGHCQLQLKGKTICHQRKSLLLCQAATLSFMLGKWSIGAGSLWICASRNF